MTEQEIAAIRLRSAALAALRPGAIWAMQDGVVEWFDEIQTMPTEEEITAKVAQLIAIASFTIGDVKTEAGRRIEAIMPDYKQRNVLAFGLETIMTYGADPSQWPEPLQQVNADMQAKWEAIKAIRVRSDEIEAMDPIPTDFRDDSYW